MNQFLQPTGQAGDYLNNLRQAAQGTGSGGGSGDTYLKVDDRSGAMTYGKEGVPFPEGHRMVAGLQGFRHGYIDSQGGQVVDRNVVPMMTQPARPTPPGGQYGSYSRGGPRNVTEVELHSIDEPGFSLVFTAWGVSSANRIRNLLELALNQANTPDGQGGFIHPVIVPKAGKFHLKAKPPSRENPDGIAARDVWHFDFTIVDWLHADGQTLLSKGARPAVTQAGNGGEADEAPWDDEEVDDDLLR